MRLLACVILFLAVAYWLFGPGIIDYILHGSPDVLLGITIGICLFVIAGHTTYRRYHDC